MAFTTKDKDQDSHTTTNCATNSLGAWWYKNCSHSDLNKYNNGAAGKGAIYWNGFASSNIKSVQMAIRPI
jgi:ficolin